MSSLTMALAVNSIRLGNMPATRIWLLLTAMLGSIFVGGQVFEFTTFVHKGLTLEVNLFGTTFFVLTGFHGTHVTVGIIILLSLLLASLLGRLTPRQALTVEVAGLYWHFVDIVWVVILTVVYLLPY
jgi:heme/copper-type cytochrome/quinol oxidase subunit 3